MQTITITGGQTLHGQIRPAGAKNSVLPLLAATLLCGAPCRLCGVPRLADVDTSLALLRAVGAKAVRKGADLCTQPAAPEALCGEIPEALAGAMRSSVFYLAPLLCRAGSVRLPLPGGCRLGPRPVDIHLAGLAAMGAGLFYLTGFEQWQTTASAVPAMGFNGIAAAFLGGLNPIGSIFSSYFIQHITNGGAYVDKTMYSAQIADFISALIIYLCGFVLFFKSFMDKRADRRAEAKALAAKQAAENGEGGDK